MVGSRLSEVKPSYYQGQNTITINWRSYQQVKGSQVLQQVGLNLGIQQYSNKRRRWMKSSLLNKQKTIQTSSDVLWIVQLSRNISTNNEQYIPGTTI